MVWTITTIFLTESFHPPAKEKRQLLKNPKKSNYYCLLHGLNQAHIKQGDYLLLYEQNWLKEGTEGIVLKKTAESSK